MNRIEIAAQAIERSLLGACRRRRLEVGRTVREHERRISGAGAARASEAAGALDPPLAPSTGQRSVSVRDEIFTFDDGGATLVRHSDDPPLHQALAAGGRHAVDLEALSGV